MSDLPRLEARRTVWRLLWQQLVRDAVQRLPCEQVELPQAATGASRNGQDDPTLAFATCGEEGSHFL